MNPLIAPYPEIYDREVLAELGWKFGWSVIRPTKDPHLISFSKDYNKKPARINAWPGTMTVGTYISHPTKGKTQLFRRNVDMKLMEKIFKNPRIHTGKGYR